MTKKELKKEQIENYRNYAEGNNIHQPALKGCGINFGSHGNLVEMVVKYALNNYNWKGIALAKHTDTRKKINGKICTIEIKTGGGELATIATTEFKKMGGARMPAEWRNEKFDTTPKSSNCFKAEYVVYIPEPDLSYDLISQAYVLTGSDFEMIMKELGLIRYKQSTELCNRKADYYDKFAIADLGKSKKRRMALYDLLDEYGTGLAEWIDENIIENE